MDIRGRRKSSNVEDRRGMRPVRTGVGLSIGGVLFLVVLSLFGINPLPFRYSAPLKRQTGSPGTCWRMTSVSSSSSSAIGEFFSSGSCAPTCGIEG